MDFSTNTHFLSVTFDSAAFTRRGLNHIRGKMPEALKKKDAEDNRERSGERLGVGGRILRLGCEIWLR